MNICTITGENQTVTKTFDMTTGYKVTELFCIIDEFCKHFYLLPTCCQIKVCFVAGKINNLSADRLLILQPIGY